MSGAVLSCDRRWAEPEYRAARPLRHSAASESRAAIAAVHSPNPLGSVRRTATLRPNTRDADNARCGQREMRTTQDADNARCGQLEMRTTRDADNARCGICISRQTSQVRHGSVRVCWHCANAEATGQLRRFDWILCCAVVPLGAVSVSIVCLTVHSMSWHGLVRCGLRVRSAPKAVSPSTADECTAAPTSPL
jgi:hypothetical protein